MTDLRTAAQQALEALYEETAWFGPTPKGAAAITALRAALAQQAEPVVGIIEPQIKVDSHQTLDDATRLPRAMAQAYESGYNAGVANEREACAKVCEVYDDDRGTWETWGPRFAEMIRARSNT